MSATIIPIRPPANAGAPAARLRQAIALSVQMRAALAPGFPVASEMLAGINDRLAGEEVRLRSLLAVMVAGPGGDAA